MSEELKIENDVLLSARVVDSPNCSDRESDEISLLVIHNISLPPGEFGGGHVDELFCNCLDRNAHPFFAEIVNLRVSAHLLVERGGRVTQYVPFNRKAWHAGDSSFNGRSNCNDFSIGIELEGTDDSCFTDIQYRTLEMLTKALMKEYPRITHQRIVGHSDVAPGRKTDPGPKFDWQRFLNGLKNSQAEGEGK